LSGQNEIKKTKNGSLVYQNRAVVAKSVLTYLI